MMYLHIRSLVMLIATVMVYDVGGYHILCYHPLPSRSHDQLAAGVINPLIRAGHRITWVTPFPNGKPENVTIIDVSQTIAIGQGLNMTNVKVSGFEIAKSFSDKITKASFTEDLQRALIQNQYDAVITEWFFSDVEAGFAAIQKVPWILISGFPMHRHLQVLMDPATSLLSVPALGHAYPTPLNFWNRLKTTGAHLFRILDDWITYTTEASVYESFFGPVATARGVTLPPLSTAARDVAVLLVNGHPSFSHSHSVPPNVVEIGGYHIEEHFGTPLPKDLQSLLDSAHTGAIYFSLGSMMTSSSLPERTRRDLVALLAATNRTVLWKYEREIPGLPHNIHVRAWMPQNSILAHPNTKLFITHCGLLSTLEALQHGVPLLAVPVFGDQPENAARAARAGHAVTVPFDHDMKDEFGRALETLLGDDRYYKKAQYMSRLFRRRPVAPSALITHYVELAIETDGAHHLRPSTQLYSWHQLSMFDQLAALLAAALLVYLVVRKIASSLITCDLERKHNKKQN